jgi:hypothetical protein
MKMFHFEALFATSAKWAYLKSASKVVQNLSKVVAGECAAFDHNSVDMLL